jgi:16S rRNA (cytosine967-C5)-methyltransferase
VARPTSPARPLREPLIAQVAVEVYGLIRHQGRLADRALDATLRRRRQLWSGERRAVGERVYALLRRQRLVDFTLERLGVQPSALPATEADALRLAVARVLGGERPEKVAQGGVGIGAAQLARAREVAAQVRTLPWPTRLGIAHSFPDFLVERFAAEFGDDAEPALAAMNVRAPAVARANTLKTDRARLLQFFRDQGVPCHPTPLSPLGIAFDERVHAVALPEFKQGLFELQDEGSQLLGLLVDPPPTRVVDACAGVGGKALQLAAAMKNRGELFALDIAGARLEELRKRARRAGVHNVRARVIPASGAEALRAVADLEGKADRVLVDAPCSGSGTFRRKPDARYHLRPEEIAAYAQKQRELLERFGLLVKPGGRLIYGTCSVLGEENEEVVEAFLRAHPEFSVRAVSEELGAAVGAQVDRGGYLRLAPHRHGTDGFFGAILVRSR